MEAFDSGVTIEDIYLHILEPAEKELGRLWLEKRITVGQEHFTSAVTQLVMSLLYYPCIIRILLKYQKRRGRSSAAAHQVSCMKSG